MGCTAASAAIPPEQSIDAFRTEYALGATLGEGAFGKVRAVKRKVPGKSEVALAVKILGTKGPSRPKDVLLDVQRELQLAKRIGEHPNIVKVHSLYIERTTGTCVGYLLMEQCGRTLQSLTSQVASDENLLRSSLEQMLAAIDHVHAHGVLHRDVKLDNYMVGLSTSSVKLCDFGSAAVLPFEGYLTSRTGTPAYMAPEVIQQEKYSYPVDVWSCGVCCYVLLCRCYPYETSPYDGSRSAQRGAIVRGAPPSFEAADGHKLGAAAVELARALLKRKPAHRPSAAEALSYAYFTEDEDDKEDTTDLWMSKSTSHMSKSTGVVSTKYGSSWRPTSSQDAASD